MHSQSAWRVLKAYVHSTIRLSSPPGPQFITSWLLILNHCAQTQSDTILIGAQWNVNTLVVESDQAREDRKKRVCHHTLSLPSSISLIDPDVPLYHHPHAFNYRGYYRHARAERAQTSCQASGATGRTSTPIWCINAGGNHFGGDAKAVLSSWIRIDTCIGTIYPCTHSHHNTAENIIRWHTKVSYASTWVTRRGQDAGISSLVSADDRGRSWNGGWCWCWDTRVWCGDCGRSSTERRSTLDRSQAWFDSLQTGVYGSEARICGSCGEEAATAPTATAGAGPGTGATAATV